jgi:carboxyl-terminal processing protease
MNILYSFLKKSKRLLVLGSVILVMFVSSAFVNNYFEISKNMEIFTSLYRELNIYYVDETQPGGLMKTGIDAMLRSLDPYTVYYPESKIEDYRFMTTGHYGGIGAIVQQINDEIVIAEPQEGFSAQKAGLQAGDVVLKIDGQEVGGRTIPELGEILKGQAGTEVTITVRRPYVDQILDIKVVRDDVKIPDVPFYAMLDDKTGYIKLTGFTRTASSDVRNAFKDLKDKQGMQQLIFDLRGNGGGLLAESVNIVNFFVPKGSEIVSTKGKLEEWNRTHMALNEPLDTNIPIVVLIDGGSASASEIVSGAIQDFDRGVLIGSLSYGKGLVQQTKDLAYNTKLKLTVAKYYIPSGRCIQKLDYSHRNEFGEVDAVPDSLIKAFTTLGGRTVQDGRGIMPDIEVTLDEASNILKGLVLNHVIFDFATKYHHDHDSIADPASFRLTEQEYKAFEEFALSRSFEYNSATERYFEKLKEMAMAEKYYDGSEAQFEALQKSIAPEKSRDLQKFSDQIKRELELEIVLRYTYQTGKIRNALSNDPFVDEAMSVFNTSYKDILKPVTTD